MTSSSRYEEIMKTKPYLPLRMGYLTEDMVARAEKELGETEEIKAGTIPELRKMIEKESKLVCPTNDDYLLQYLRARKYNVKKAFSLCKNYHDVKKSYADIYDTCDPEILRKVMSYKALQCLPYRDDDGCAIYLLKMARWDPDQISLSEGVVGLTIMILFCIEDPATQVCGVQIMIDVRGASLKQLRCITPRFMHLFSKALRNCLACRFKGIHLFNESMIFHYIWSVFKFFLSEKINKRVHFHGDNQKNLHKCIPKAILPSEYGGDNPQDVGEWFNAEIEKYFPRYAELITYGYKD